MRITRTLRLLQLFLVPALIFAEITLPGCGNEGETACGPTDSEYWANWPGTAMPCDFGLYPDGGLLSFFGDGSTCRNGSYWGFQPRLTQALNTTWTGWALAQQRYGIGGDAPMNYVTTIGTHNSFSTLDGGFTNIDSQDQILSITDQLQLGARYIRLDERYYEGQMRLCHGSNSFCAGLTSTISPGRLYANAVKEVANWLFANPNEFIILDLNGDPQGHNGLVMAPILAYIGPSRIVTTADAQCAGSGTGCTFPTLNKARALGRQVLIFSSSFTDATYTFTRNDFNEKDPFDASTTTQTFQYCVDMNGKPIYPHDGNTWPYTSEDRSGSVLFLSPASFLGFLDEPEVQQATTCGYSIIAIDYLNNRSHTYPENSLEYSTLNMPPFPSEVTTDAPDNRFQSTIWSFDVDDYAANTYAYMKANARWSTAPAATQYAYACSNQAPGQFLPSPDWMVTTQTGPFQNGESACQAHSALWHFARPVNGAQNAALAQVANGQLVWVNYKAQPVPGFAAQPNLITATMEFGSTPPPAQQILVGGPVNGTVGVTAIPGVGNLNWLSLSNYALSLGQTGSATLNVGFSGAASSLAPGIYSAKLGFVETGGANAPQLTTTTATVRLAVHSTPTISLACPTAALEGQSTHCVATLQAPGTNPAAFIEPVTLYSVDTTGNTASTALGSVAVDPTLHQATFSFSAPIGNLTLIAKYPGDAVYNPVSSSAAQVHVMPFLIAAPSSETISFPAGQISQVSGLSQIVFNSTTSAIPQSSCSTSPCWLSGVTLADAANPKLEYFRLFLTPAAAALAPGTYNAQVTIRDFIHADDVVPITLHVTTSLTAQNQTLLGGTARVSGVIPVGVANGASNIPITASSDAPWLTVAVGGSAPTNIGIVADPTGLPFGVNVAHVTISSPLAPSIFATVQFTVAPMTTVTTNPPGLGITVDGVNYTSPATFLLDPRISHKIGTVQSATANQTTWAFQSWSDGGPISHPIQAPAQSGQATRFTADFKATAYQVNITPAPSNWGTVTLSPSPGSGDMYAPNTKVTVSARPFNGFVFEGYKGGISSQSPSYTFTLTAPVNASALFLRANHVTIETVPAGLSIQVDGATVATPFSAWFAQNSRHVVAAPQYVPTAPGARYAFWQWNNGSTAMSQSFVVSQDLNLSASFKTQYRVSTNSNPANAGHVTVANASNDGYYDAGSQLSMTAVPAAGFTFGAFSGAETSASNPTTIAATGVIDETADFNAGTGPVLFANTAGQRSSSGGLEIVPLNLTNASASGVGDIHITGIDGIQIVSGTGSVALSTPVPVALGDLGPGMATAPFSLLFRWPDTAVRVRFTVHFTADAGRYSGSTTLTVNR